MESYSSMLDGQKFVLPFVTPFLSSKFSDQLHVVFCKVLETLSSVLDSMFVLRQVICSPEAKSVRQASKYQAMSTAPWSSNSSEVFQLKRNTEGNPNTGSMLVRNHALVVGSCVLSVASNVIPHQKGNQTQTVWMLGCDSL